jgi:dsDNA-specific endonuclease/ATPase MutS2
LKLKQVQQTTNAIFKKRGEPKAMAKLKLDLHDIFNKGDRIEDELHRIINEAVQKRIALVEIIPGKGSGVLKERVIKFLNQGHIRKLYHRVEKDSKNFGRIFVHFRFQ